MLRAFRIVKARHAARAFDGEGARRHGGRWTSPGVAAVYLAESAALAVLEVLVHLESSALLPSYVLIEARFPERKVESLDPRRLPAGWSDSPPPLALRALGDAWLREGRSALLRVPSAVVPSEWNYLLNPAHPGFGAVRIGSARAFILDPRLLVPGRRTGR
jgi:RES domain-containing protein